MKTVDTRTATAAALIIRPALEQREREGGRKVQWGGWGNVLRKEGLSRPLTHEKKKKTASKASHTATLCTHTQTSIPT